MSNYKTKQQQYKKAIEVLNEIYERQKDHVFDNPKEDLFKKHLESLDISIGLIEQDIPYLNPNY